jgi:hypothetical protein
MSTIMEDDRRRPLPQIDMPPKAKPPRKPRAGDAAPAPLAKVTPVDRKIGEGAGNLRARAAAFRKRRQGA